MYKRMILAAILAVAVVLLVPSVALANFAIHGNYVADTDACAGCHRAHTSISSVTWSDGEGWQHDALLTSSATQLWQFCYACHDSASQGADTNVQDGLYEGTSYGSTGAVLNGGGFGAPTDPGPWTSTHMYWGAGWGAYGGGYAGQGSSTADGQDPNANNAGETAPIKMDCASCHDPHGSANYRILKAQVFGNPVGGYNGTGTDPDPDGFVSSTETGWPDQGFRLHQAYPDYQPNYTTPMYAKGYNMAAGTTNPAKGMSGWCAGCHATYNGQAGSEDSTYNAGDGGGLKMRHRHPINVPLSNYAGPDADSMVVDKLPLAHDLGEKGATADMTAANAKSDWIECLTCHRAHGTSVTMTGWANQLAADPNDDVADFVSRSGSGDPSALLRMNNRGVCEACHNK